MEMTYQQNYICSYIRSSSEGCEDYPTCCCVNDFWCKELRKEQNNVTKWKSWKKRPIKTGDDILVPIKKEGNKDVIDHKIGYVVKITKTFVHVRVHGQIMRRKPKNLVKIANDIPCPSFFYIECLKTRRARSKTALVMMPNSQPKEGLILNLDELSATVILDGKRIVVNRKFICTPTTRRKRKLFIQLRRKQDSKSS